MIEKKNRVTKTICYVYDCKYNDNKASVCKIKTTALILAEIRPGSDVITPVCGFYDGKHDPRENTFTIHINNGTIDDLQAEI